MRKILVIGSGGMLGHVTTLFLREQGYDVTDISRSRKCRDETVLLDVFEQTRLENFLGKAEYDVIINCVAILPVDSLKDKGKTIWLNSYFPHYLEHKYRGTQTRIIQISTGGVYGGDKAPYDEESLHDTGNFYGKTKSLGEIDGSLNLNIRSDFIGPDMSPDGSGLFNWIMKSEGDISGYGRVIFNGVSSLEFAKFVCFAVENRVTGTYNLHSSNSISKARFIQLICDRFHKSLNISFDDSKVHDTSLISSRTDVGYHTKTFEQQLDELYVWMCEHKAYYLHYF